jgi:hypothetical protein
MGVATLSERLCRSDVRKGSAFPAENSYEHLGRLRLHGREAQPHGKGSAGVSHGKA